MTPFCSNDARLSRKDRRLCGRLRTEQLETGLGKVVNLSASGLGLISRQDLSEAIGERVEVTVNALSERIVLRAEIVWVRRRGFRKYLIGVCFADLAEEDRRKLNGLARTAVLLPGLGNQYTRSQGPMAA